MDNFWITQKPYIQMSKLCSLSPTVSIQLGHPVSIIVGRFCLLCRRCRFGNDVDISRIFNASLSPLPSLRDQLPARPAWEGPTTQGPVISGAKRNGGRGASRNPCFECRTRPEHPFELNLFTFCVLQSTELHKMVCKT